MRYFDKFAGTTVIDLRNPHVLTTKASPLEKTEDLVT